MQNQNHHLHLVLNDEENTALREKANQWGLSMSGFIRRLILNKEVWSRPPEELLQLYAEINRIGTNINQIARNCNAGANPDSCAAQALFLLKKVYETMESIG